MIHYTCMKEALKTESPIMVMRTTRSTQRLNLIALGFAAGGLGFVISGLGLGFRA